MTRYTATFLDGRTATRTSDRTYTHAASRAGRVSFHQSFGAAQRAAGAHGAIVRVEGAAAVASCVVCGDDPRGVPQVSAVTRETSWTPCWGSAHRA